MEKESLPNLNAATGGFSYTIYVIFYLVLSVVASLIIQVSGLTGDGQLYLSYLVAPIAVALCLLFIMKFKHVRFQEYVHVKAHPKYYLIALLLVFGLLFSLNWLNTVSVEFFKLFGYIPRADRNPESSSVSAYLPSVEGGLVVPVLLVVAVIPAIFEETLFRGMILNNCRQGLGDIATIFVVGFCFSLSHASPEQTVYQFVCGCIFAFLAIRAGSYLPCVFMHFINNGFIIIAYACGWVNSDGNLAVSEGGNIAILVVAAVSLVAGLVWLILDRKPLYKKQKGQTKAFFLYAALGIVALAVLWICSLFGVG